MHIARYPKVIAVFATLLCFLSRGGAALAGPPIYVVLWFDTEDYLLPASDDAALHLATFLTEQNIRGTFKVVGEKARTLERRGRTDVIEALKKHDIGYHSNFHSVQPTPAVYLDALGWDDGVAEFDRRERPGVDDLKRIFGVMPSCYGQPGSSWAPQTLGAMRNWGMKVYLDAGKHVALDGKPFYYCGLLNIYRITHMPRTSIKDPGDLAQTEEKFAAARQELQAEGGGLISIIYHPCEFVHKEFWDGVNFRGGANPPRDQWKVPPAKTPEESRVAFENWESYIRYMKHFDDVRFITATDAVKLYADEARGRARKPAEIREIAAAVGDTPGFQRHDSFTLSAAETLSLLCQFVAARSAEHDARVVTPDVIDGPSSPSPTQEGPVTVDRSQFLRTVADVADSLDKQKRVPSAVWLGSRSVTPEAFLVAVAAAAQQLTDGKPVAETVEIRPAKLSSVRYVADDNPGLWGWVIFPPNFHAPNVMALAKRQAWTLKPAVRHDAK